MSERRISPGLRMTRSRSRRRDAQLGSLLSTLPDDLTIHLFGWLDARQLWCFMQTCRRFHAMASEDCLWRALLALEVGEANLPSAPSEPGCWRRRFWKWQGLESCALTPVPRAPHDPLCLTPKAPTVRAGHARGSHPPQSPTAHACPKGT